MLGAGAAAGVVALAATAAPATEPGRAPVKAIAPARCVDFVCGRCGGNSVARDAWAEWDVCEQDWVLGAAFDHAFCHDCNEETHLEEIEAAASGAD